MKGFTIIEIMVVFLILVLMLGGIFGVLKIADLSRQVDAGQLDLQQEVRQAIDGMIREARQSRPADISVDISGSRVDFFLPGVSNSISYYLRESPNNPDEYQIVRKHPPDPTIEPKVLANNISSLSFCCSGGADCQDCANARVLQIGVQAAKTIRDRPLSFHLTEKVRLRNE